MLLDMESDYDVLFKMGSSLFRKLVYLYKENRLKNILNLEGAQKG